MKKKFLLVLTLVVLFCSTSSLKSYAQEEQITSFVSDVTFNEDATIDVKEEIHYYFSYERHGIYREIPVNYKVAGSFVRPTKLILNDLYYYPKGNEELKKTAYSSSMNNGYKIFQIGEEDTYIQGYYVYIIDYTLKYAVNYFPDHDELYLNITGDSWNIPIASASVNIHLPADITESVCYTGGYNSEEQNCLIENIDKKNIRVSITKPLDMYEGYTVAVSMPVGSVANTEGEQRIQWMLANIGIFLPIPIFIFLMAWVKKNGKNKKITIIPNYHAPKDITPMLSGFVYTKKFLNKYITASLIDLAVRGYLKIKQLSKKQYELIRTEKKDTLLVETEKELLKGIFGEKETMEIRKISNSFYRTVNRIIIKIGNQVYEEELFSKKRKKMRGKLVTFGMVGIILVVMLNSWFILNAATGWLIGFLLSAISLFIASSKVDLRGKKGNKIYFELKGLRMYIDTAETKRIEFHNDPKKFRGIFEKLLPYAMIFGLEKKWAKEFEDLYETPPNWYIGTDSFTPYMMIGALTSMNSTIKHKSIAPGSSGGFRSSGGASGGSGFSGGSSGGGFGGGGGGSW